FTANATKLSLSNNIVQFQFRGNPGDEPATFLWNFGDGSANSTEENPIYQYNFPGTYTVILTVIDADGDTDVLIRFDYIKVQKEPVIPGYSFFFLIGILSVIVIIISKNIFIKKQNFRE
ncbi:MAG: PKD domain-containing protein, partial [Promethearchaeota archaeon]